jgi:hypothetical protein
VRLLDTRRARLLLLGTTVLALSLIYVLMLLNPAPVPTGAPAHERPKPPFPAHEVALVPSA